MPKATRLITVAYKSRRLAAVEKKFGLGLHNLEHKQYIAAYKQYVSLVPELSVELWPEDQTAYCKNKLEQVMQQTEICRNQIRLNAMRLVTMAQVMHCVNPDQAAQHLSLAKEYFVLIREPMPEICPVLAEMLKPTPGLKA